MGEVFRLQDWRTPQQLMELRASRLNRGESLRISSIKQALAYGDGWQRMYRHLEAAHTLACEQLRASELIIEHYTAELERVRKLVQQ